MAAPPLIIPPQDTGAPGLAVRGMSLVIQDWAADGPPSEYAPLHVHHADDEAWHVVSGALRFRFGSAGIEPSRYIIILPTRLDELISQLHAVDRSGLPRRPRGGEAARVRRGEPVSRPPNTCTQVATARAAAAS